VTNARNWGTERCVGEAADYTLATAAVALGALNKCSMSGRPVSELSLQPAEMVSVKKTVNLEAQLPCTT
jgi:hypothetical protein